MAVSVSISPVTTKADRQAFVDLPYRAYRHLPAWRAPLRLERSMFLNPKHNPLLARMDHQLFLARRGDRVVGRISAHVNPDHLREHGGGTGHFGFLDTYEPDEALQHALLKTAEDWLRGRGMTRIGGPYNFSVNDECGLLIDGFDMPPMIMMPYGRPDYGPAMESAGYAKAMDVFALRHEFGETYRVPARVSRLLKGIARNPELSIRSMDMKNFRAEVDLVMDIFNDAWSRNWGFIPFGEEQIKSMARELRPLIRPDSMWIAFINGEAAGFVLFLPDINELAQGLDGRLLPFGWARFLWRLKVRGATRARLPLAGLRRKFHKTPRGLYAMSACYEAAFRAQFDHGVRTLESGWILETNTDLLNLCALYEMPAYKTYRLYDKAL